VIPPETSPPRNGQAPLAPEPVNTAMQDEQELHQLVGALLRRWPLVLGMALAVACAVGVRSMTALPTFSVSGTMYLDDGQGAQANRSPDDFLSDYQLVADVNSQVQLLQSKSLIEQVVLETGLNADVEPEHAVRLPYWRWRFFNQRAIRVFAPTAGTLVARAATLSDPAVTDAKFVLTIGPGETFKVSQLMGKTAASAEFLGMGALGQTFTAGGVSFMLSPAEGMTPPAPGSVYHMDVIPADEMADAVLGDLHVQAEGPSVAPTNVAQVQFVWPNPYQATVFVNQLMNDFIENQVLWKTKSATATEAYVTAQLTTLGASLNQASQTQANYQSQTGILDAGANAQALTDQLNTYQTQRSQLLLQQEQLQSLVDDISHGNATLDPYLFSQVPDPVLSGLATTLAAAQVQLQSLSVQYTSDSPQVINQTATIARIKQSIAVLLHNDLDTATKSLANLDTLIASYRASLKNVPAESLQVGQLARSTDVLGTLYGALMQKAEEAEISKADAVVATRVIAPAELPVSPFAPRPGLSILTGFVVGAVIGIAIVMVRRGFSLRLPSEAEILAVAPLPVFGRLPAAGGEHWTEARLASVGAQLFKRKVLDQLVRYGRLTVLLTAPGAEAERPMTALTLAASLARDGRRVLLIDADLRLGLVSHQLGLATAPGLADWLVMRGKPPVHAGLPAGLNVLAAGLTRTEPGTFLTVGQLSEPLALLRPAFEVIIIDAPPLPAVGDTLALLPFADLVLSVVMIDWTSRPLFLRHRNIIKDMGRPHALVICGLQPESSAYGAAQAGGGPGHGLREMLRHYEEMVRRTLRLRPRK
jgi:uncharacterized protein involved in exopolysaccharide biosynthesis